MITCLGLTVLYVGSLYVCAGNGDRDSPLVIKKRLVGVVFSSLVALLVAGVDLQGLSVLQSVYSFIWGGSVSLAIYISDIAKVGVVGVVNKFKVDCWSSGRNLLIGPISEELVFRYSFYRILRLSGYSIVSSVLFSTLLFWLAHAHHYSTFFKTKSYGIYCNLFPCRVRPVYKVGISLIMHISPYRVQRLSDTEYQEPGRFHCLLISVDFHLSSRLVSHLRFWKFLASEKWSLRQYG